MRREQIGVSLLWRPVSMGGDRHSARTGSSFLSARKCGCKRSTSVSSNSTLIAAVWRRADAEVLRGEMLLPGFSGLSLS